MDLESLLNALYGRRFSLASVVLLGAAAWRTLTMRRQLKHIASVGSSGFLTSYLSAFRWYTDARSILLEGYKKHKVFKVPEFTDWIVVVSDPKLVDELRLASDQDLSFSDLLYDLLAMKYTVGESVHTDQYHVPVIRGVLTRNIPARLEDVREEIEDAFNDLAPTQDNEWTPIKPFKVMSDITFRASNRMFFGLPLCRDKRWQSINERFDTGVGYRALILSCLPEWVQPIVSIFDPLVPISMWQAKRLLTPLINERLAMEGEKPSDLLTWFIDAAPSQERKPDPLIRRMLFMSLVAQHQVAATFSSALMYLAAEPDKYIPAMRKEVELCIAQDGWTKTAAAKMRILDSFLRESQRVAGTSHLSLSRKAMKDYTFSDGTFIPKGITVWAPSVAIQIDEAIYGPDAASFDGFRFSNMREEEGEGTKHHFVSTSNTYLPFGHGRHACPGRFFVGNELKTMLAHLVLNYDVKLEDEKAGRPKDFQFAAACLPNMKARVLLRKRQD